MNKAGIKKLIRKGEGISVEFKECRNKLNKDVFESICAFLNRNGGDLILGVNDSGKITGIAPEAVEQIKKELVTALNNPQKLNPPCYLMPEEVIIEGKRISLRDHIFREVAANMLIHREFLNPYPAKFIIETHRLFAENSNKPHGHGLIDPANFSPFPKNPVIARFFKEIGRADELGSGVRNLFKYCRHYSGGKTPELIEEDIFRCIVPLTPQATPQVTPQDERAQRILEFCQPPRTREEIQAFIKIKDREYFRKNFLQPLLKQGLLKPTIPDKPTSSKQKYYATKEKKIR